ncbi:MAG: hypothetical protein ACLUCH_06195 [Lachnospirales bacterium]
MKYRKITDLTDEEIKEAFKIIFEVDNVEVYYRNKRDDFIECSMETIWGNKETKNVIIDFFKLSCYGIEDIWNDYPISDEEEYLFEKFLVAKCCYHLQKDNPFL